MESKLQHRLSVTNKLKQLLVKQFFVKQLL